MQLFSKEAMWDRKPLKDRYRIVIIGGGVHGLSIAYYLGKHGISDVAVLDRSYLGGGGSARSTAIIRANYVTKDGIPFFHQSLKLYEDLSQELNYNLLFSQFGRVELGHTESALYALRIRSEANRAMGVNSREIGPETVKQMIPAIDMRVGKTFPILGGLYHPPGGVIRHDAVVWAYGRGAARFGAELHPHTEVTGIRVDRGRVSGVETTRGNIDCDIVVNSTAGWCSTIAQMVDIDLPIVTMPLQACVTEPLKPFLHKTVSSANLHVYVYQTDRGEVVIGGAVDPYPTYSQASTLPMLETLAAHTLELFPCLANVNILRQWGGLCDMTPDYAPVMGEHPDLGGFILNCGWGTWGFKAAPAAGMNIAELIATDKVPDIIRPFAVTRFKEGKLVNERGGAPAAAVQ